MSETPAEIIASQCVGIFYPAQTAEEQAASIIAALAAAGYKIMPREPTEAMVTAFALCSFHDGEAIYRGIWDAA